VSHPLAAIALHDPYGRILYFPIVSYVSYAFKADPYLLIVVWTWKCKLMKIFGHPYAGLSETQSHALYLQPD